MQNGKNIISRQRSTGKLGLREELASPRDEVPNWLFNIKWSDLKSDKQKPHLMDSEGCMNIFIHIYVTIMIKDTINLTG